MFEDWIDILFGGSHDINLPTLSVTGGVGPLTGSGRISWRRDEGIRLQGVTDGAQALQERLFGRMNSSTPGQLIPHSEFLTFVGRNQYGWDVTTDATTQDGYRTHSDLPDVVWDHTVTGVTLTQEDQRDQEHVLRLLIGPPAEDVAEQPDTHVVPHGLAISAVTTDLFPLPWSHYVRLLSIENLHARHFYEAEAIRGAWSVRQLDRQIGSQFYERTALSRNKAALLSKGQVPQPGDALTAEEEIRDPLVLEFLNLKDEYGESELEEALVQHLEAFLLELGDDFCFVGRQRKLRLDDKWFKIDLVFFHRRLRCVILIDLKLGAFGHADAGQMNLYLNYAKEHWTREGENPPVGLILCAKKGHDEARYALEGLGNKVLASTYRMTLPDEQVLAAELERTRRALELRATAKPDENPSG
ncbi:PDDEXK nuclease domain-containing protein [Frigoriglobus tundricola]|uniref:Cytoplasmic protein n=1 Tax=Frigoriglobus tundricola TaxID=2774151 RepID=A0A6M5Z653_9BACT|nr:PDDEXK nuclease domain-containing protein [Frigoriglobus tundricola]QJX01062.1 hypothetical protein FTUN_8701 [Frigoriglobus tundricola]